MQYQYDAIGRVTTETFPDNSATTYAYSGLTTTVTNSLGQTRTKIKNSQGQVVTAQDTNASYTSFAYDPFGNLATTTDDALNVTSFTYDTRGRKIAMTDPDIGSWSYVYDALGQLVQQTDAKAQVTTFTYDLLGRPLTRTEPDLTSTWTYDTQAHGVGKLASASATSGYSRTPSYDALGRPSSTQITVDASNTYSVGTSYDGNGRIDTVTYPSGFATKNVYTALGYLQTVENAAVTTTVYWTASAMDAEQHLTQFQHGNGVATTQTFDPATGRLTAIQAGSSNAVQNLSFAWDTLGNLQTRTDAVQNVVENFGYDALNRLTSAQIVDGPAAKSYSYDTIGNITVKSDVGTYSYSASHPHAVSSVTGTVNGQSNPSYTYDANGNLLTGAGRTAVWMSFNMMASLAEGANTLAFTYDSEHGRIKQTAPEGTTFYFNDPASGLKVEKFAGTGGATQWNNYIYAAGMMVAVYYDGPNLTRYFHKDHLGSIQVITDETGNVVERDSYDPWGKRRFLTGADDPNNTITSLTTRGYTGQEQLADVALVHLNGRIYDPQLGRMMSADPFVQDVLNTQSLNRYAYVLNNPLALTDPSGYFSLGSVVHAISSVFHSTVGRAVIAIAAAATAQYELLPELGIASSSLEAAVISGAIGGGIAGGSLKGAIIGGFTAAAFYEVGDITGPLKSELPGAYMETARFAANIAGHAVVGCVSAAAGGGQCGPAAFAGAAGAAVGPMIGPDLAIGTTASAIIGGTASAIGGAKFANGAITASFGYLYNHWAHGVAGTRANYALAEELNRRDGAGTWMVNSGLGGLLTGRADLANSVTGELYELKTMSCLSSQSCNAAALDQLRTYLSDADGQYRAGSDFTVFRGLSNFSIESNLYGVKTGFTYYAQGDSGLIGYERNVTNEWLQAVVRAYGQQRNQGPAGGPLPLRFVYP